MWMIKKWKIDIEVDEDNVCDDEQQWTFENEKKWKNKNIQNSKNQLIWKNSLQFYLC